MLNIIQVPNTSIGKQMSLNQEFFFHTPSHEIVSLSGKEVRYIFDYKKYKKRLGDLPVGTAIEVQSPCNPALHLVKQDDFTRLVGDRQSCLVSIALHASSAMLEASNPYLMKIDYDNPLVIKYISALESSLKNIDGDTFYTTAVLNGTDPTRYFCYRQLFYTDEEVAKARKEYEDALNNMTNLISSK